MLGLVVVMWHVNMNLGKILCEEACSKSLRLDGGGLFLHNVASDTTEEVVVGSGNKSLLSLPWILTRLESGLFFHSEIGLALVSLFERACGCARIRGRDFVLHLPVQVDCAHSRRWGVTGGYHGVRSAVIVATIVILDDTPGMALGNRWDRTAPPEQRAFDDFPTFQSPILHHQTAVEEWKQENGIQNDNTGRGAQDCSDRGPNAPVIQVERGR